MSSQPELVELSAKPAMTIRTHSPVESLSDIFGRGYGEIFHVVERQGQQPIGPPFCIYHNMDMSNLDIEFGFPVVSPMDSDGRVKCTEMPGGQFATYKHVGPYDAIESAYNTLGAWIDRKGYDICGDAFEVYLNDPAETPPEQLETQIYFPVRKH